MDKLTDEIIAEASELTVAVFDKDETGFEEGYEGGQGSYLLVEDLKARIDEAYLDSSNGLVSYEDLPDFSDFEYDTETVGQVFYRLEPDPDIGELSEKSGLTRSAVEGLIDDFQDAGLVEEENGKFFYAEPGLSYFKVLGEAELVVNEGSGDEWYGGETESLSETSPVEDFGKVEGLEEEVCGEEDAGRQVSEDDEYEEADQDEDEDQFSRLQSIMEDAVDSDDDFVSTETRDGN